MAMVFCSECGKEISDQAKTCIHCGCPLSVTFKIIKCPKCGFERKLGDTECVKCGILYEKFETFQIKKQIEQKEIAKKEAAEEIKKQNKEKKKAQKIAARYENKEKKEQHKEATRTMREAEKINEKAKVVKEIKATCNVCGHVWHYLPFDAIGSAGDSMMKGGCTILSCGCLSPFMSKTDEHYVKCPKCNSTAIKREKVVHRV
jgi:hypothetical protein